MLNLILFLESIKEAPRRHWHSLSLINLKTVKLKAKKNVSPGKMKRNIIVDNIYSSFHHQKGFNLLLILAYRK